MQNQETEEETVIDEEKKVIIDEEKNMPKSSSGTSTITEKKENATKDSAETSKCCLKTKETAKEKRIAKEDNKGRMKTRGRFSRRRTLLELFAGIAGLTAAVKNFAADKIKILPPGEILNKDFDLRDDECLSATADKVPKKVLWLHGAPPCHTFTFARRDDEWGKVPVLRSEERPEGFGDEKCEEANLLARRMAALAELVYLCLLYTSPSPRDRG